MKISKQLSKILIFTFFILLVQSAKAQEIKEIWSEIEKKDISNIESIKNEELFLLEVGVFMEIKSLINIF